MVRTRATRDDQAPAPPTAAVKGRGRGRGRGCKCGAARSPARAATEPVVLGQPEDRVAASEDEHRRLERFKKYDPPVFSGLASGDALGFMEECHRILRAMGISGSSGVSFTAFQLRGAADGWWRTYELDSPDEVASLTWTQFSDMFMREFVPHSFRDAWRAEFEHLRQGTMTVSEYAVRYTSLARHAPALVSTIHERVHQFIEGLIPNIRSSMARELEMDISYQQVVSIARRIEGMHAREREDRRGHKREGRRD
ncbi:uncharacterized protein [Nicotiana sylvestris]|uniref:uncharacterized protein n=1 Tax=Nicotiana sylvestris TaxID=4096 RepID=UPI00388C967A